MNELIGKKILGISINDDQSILSFAVDDMYLMPCGNSLNITDWGKVPLEDVPCPCGDPNHWLVRWEDS